MSSFPPCLRGYFIHKLNEQTLSDWGKMLTDIHRAFHAVLIIKNLFSLCPMVNFCMGHKYLYTLHLFQEVPPYTLHQTSSSLILLFFKSLTIQRSH